MTFTVLTWPVLTWPVLTWLVLKLKLQVGLQTPTSCFSDTVLILSRQHLQSYRLQTPFRHYQATCLTFTRYLAHSDKIFDLAVGGWLRSLCGGWVGCGVYVVVYRYIIMPLRGPTRKMVLVRIQFRLNSKLDPSVAIVFTGPLGQTVYQPYVYQIWPIFYLYHTSWVFGHKRWWADMNFSKIWEMWIP